MSLDQAGNLWTAGYGGVAKYDKGATAGPPAQYIHGPDTKLNQASDVALAPDGLVFVANVGGNSVTEYAPEADGDAAPKATIDGNDTNKLNGPAGVAFDQAGDLWVANQKNNTVTEYPPGAGSDTPPKAIISSGIRAPMQIAIDPDGRLWVANFAGLDGCGSVTEYASGASTGATPILTLTSANKVCTPTGVAVNAAGTLFVANWGLGSPAATVTEYAKGADGKYPASPTATLTGSNTKLSGALGIAVASAAPGHERAPLRITHIAAGAGWHRHAVAGVTFTDADPAVRLSQFSGTIAWGDGTTTAIPRRNFFKRPGGKFAAGGGHTYAKPATYTITITIRDTDGAKAKASTRLKVAGP
jgi:sugar lactone lactonase YvrE